MTSEPSHHKWRFAWNTIPEIAFNLVILLILNCLSVDDRMMRVYSIPMYRGVGWAPHGYNLRVMWMVEWSWSYIYGYYGMYYLGIICGLYLVNGLYMANGLFVGTQIHSPAGLHQKETATWKEMIFAYMGLSENRLYPNLMVSPHFLRKHEVIFLAAKWTVVVQTTKQHRVVTYIPQGKAILATWPEPPLF